MYRLSSVLRVFSLIAIGCTIGILFTAYTSIETSMGRDVRESPPFSIKPDTNIPDAILEIRRQEREDLQHKLQENMTIIKEAVRQEIMTEIRKNKTRDFIGLDSMNEVRQTLVKVKGVLAAAHRLTTSGKAKLKVRESYNIIHEMLSKADPVLKTAEPFHDLGTAGFKISPAVCPEVYKGSTYGYPFFYKGFEMETCSNVKPFREILTIVLNFHGECNSTSVKIQQILTNIQKYYKDIPVVMATNAKMKVNPAANINIVSLGESETAGVVWNKLIEQVKTEYVFIGRDLDYFDWNSRLERLVREISYLGVPLAGTSVRTENGHWTMGCQQFVYRNYTLTYREGYDISQHECVYCSYVRGPFVALKSTLLANPLQSSFGRHIVFEDLFMRLHQKQTLSIVCPDTMSYIQDNAKEQNRRASWLPLVKKYTLNRIHLRPEVVHTFSCMEAGGETKQKGIGLPPCSLQALADAIKFFMRTCEEKNIMCELQEGTLLGAVKFNKVLPWERDADLTIFSGNYTALKKLSKEFRNRGYSLNDGGGLWCCADGRQAGGKFNVGLSGWNIEVYGQHIMDTEKLANLSMPPTKVFFDGMWVNTPRNPALYVRNRYGREIFRHAQHWMTNAMSSGWAVYNTAQFSPCPQRGAHMCLDQYLTDGNLQFEVPIP